MQITFTLLNGAMNFHIFFSKTLYILSHSWNENIYRYFTIQFKRADNKEEDDMTRRRVTTQWLRIDRRANIFATGSRDHCASEQRAQGRLGVTP